MIIGYTEAEFVGSPNLREPKLLLGNVYPGAAFRRGTVIYQKTNGTITPPPAVGSGDLATAAGPLASAITLGVSAVAGAPQATHYIVTTYTDAGGESAPSAMYVVNTQAGFVPTVSVASAGHPGSADHFAAYMGFSPNFLSLEQATKTTTALGATFTPAASYANIAGYATAPTGQSTGIVGIATADSDAMFFRGGGGSFNVGGAQDPLGADITLPPLAPYEAQGVYIQSAGFGAIYEMNLIQSTPWSDYLRYTQAGITLDPTTGFHVVDPAQTACLQIVGQLSGAQIGPTASGGVGDQGTRILVQFLAAALAVQ